MSQIEANGIQIEYEERGDKGNESLILIRGLGTQLIDWPESFLAGLVGEGFHVVFFDNRDVGLSQKFDDSGVPDMGAIASGEAQPAYDLQDMADDVMGVMDALNIDKAHIMGISMGGMIVQVAAATHGERLLSMMSVMSSSGRPGLPAATEAAMASLTAQPDPAGGGAAVDLLTAEGLEICGSPGYPESLEVRLAIARSRRERNYNPGGVSRQMAAVVAAGSRVELLETIKVPSLVIHGADDPLIPVTGGEDTANCIPGCELEIVAGMGHNLPVGVVPIIVKLVSSFCHRNKRQVS
jgi:pimeloyl-ACP methyl ester carboxylesterase